MRSFTLAALMGLAAAQTTQVFNFTFDIGLVDSVERSNWCSGERNTCQALCPGLEDENTCDPDTLAMECTCNNGTAPGLEFYEQSLYSFVCREAADQCNKNGEGDAAEQQRCTTEIKDQCGTLTIDAVAPTGDSSSDDSGSSDATPTADGDSPEASETDSGALPTAFPGAAVVAAGIAAVLL